MKPTSSEQAVFAEALLRPTAEARAAYLDEACRPDLALRQRVEALLRAVENAGDFLEDPPTELSAGEQSTLLRDELSEKPGDKIGRYKLLQQIGEGGCGVVYMAEQEEPVRRRVALKVIKLGMDTKSVIARFEAERQALALMDHPNIAKVLDAGATETGRPYFVMELVRGIKITDYCDQNNLSTDARLKLFTQVCHAIQHAHQKGIIHRDIKPSNILVTQNEKEAVPKVIDFGIAKATTDQRLTEKTIFTAFEQFIGTPAYMSPEQAMMTSLDIDTRTDIYALGVLLYELLTGQTPFDANELMAAGLDAMRRTIREQEPARPSTRLSTMVDADLTTVARHRHCEPGRLGTLLRGDLDWIVMKALEKDRTRRYETASGLAVDVQRHLNNEPVIARPPTATYRFQKLVRRNRLAFAAIFAVAVALLLGVTVSAWQAIRATRSEHEQSRLRQQADVARTRAEGDQKKAESEAARSSQVAQFLKDMLKGVGPSVARGRDTAMLKEILDQTAARVGRDLTGQPEVEADLRSTIGTVYHELGDFKQAEVMYREALALRRKSLGEEHLDVARSLTSLGQVLYRQRRMAEAQAMHREALTMRVKLLGSEHLEVAASLGWVANMLRIQGALPEAEAMHRQALAMRRKLLGDEHLDVAHSLKSLALDLANQGKIAESEQLHREALTMRRKLLGNEHLDVADSIGTVASLLATQRKLSEAATWYRESIAIWRKVDPTHPDLARTLGKLAIISESEGELAEAEKSYREAVDILKKRLGGEHPDFHEYLEGLGMTLWIQGRLADAEAVFRESIEWFRHRVDPPEPLLYWQNFGSAHNRLGRLLRNAGREDEARVEFQKAATIWLERPVLEKIERARVEAEAAPKGADRWHALGETYSAFGQWQEAIEAFKKRDRIGGSAWQWFPIAVAHQQLGQTSEARAWFDKAIDWMDARQESRLRQKQAEAAVTLRLPDPWGRSQTGSKYIQQGDAFLQQGEKEKAIESYGHAIQLYESLAADFPAVPSYRQKMIILLTKNSRLAETEVAMRETVARQRKLLGDEQSEVAAMLHKLGRLLRAQGRLVEAEPFFRDAISSLDRLAQNNPENTDYQARRGHSRWQLGGVLSDTSRHDEAEVVLQEALRGFEQAARDFPTNAFFRQEQAFSHRLLAGVAKTRGRIDEAHRHYQTAIDLYAALAAGAPENTLYPREKDFTSDSLARMLRAQGKPVGTAK